MKNIRSGSIFVKYKSSLLKYNTAEKGKFGRTMMDY